jgi:hypothetical protein
MTRLRVRLRRHRAGVDEDEIGGLVAIDDGDAELPKPPGRGLHLGLVDLAAEVRDPRRADA